MYKKKNPRSTYINVRLTPKEKSDLAENAMEHNTDLSGYIRKLLNLSDND